MSEQAVSELKLETLAQVEQHIFEIVVRGLNAQGWRQARSNDPKVADCVWVAADGCKCAIGHLLVDPPPLGQVPQSTHAALAYMPAELEQFRASLVTKDGSHYRSYMNYLQSLLMLHDSNPTPDSMQLAFQYLAKHRDLKWPEGVPTTE